MGKILGALIAALFSVGVNAQALPSIPNVAAPLAANAAAYALAGAGATAANAAQFAPAAGAGAAALVGAGALAVGALAGYELMGLVLGEPDKGLAMPLTGSPDQQQPTKAPPEQEPPPSTAISYKYDGLGSVEAACMQYFERVNPGVFENDPNCGGGQSSTTTFVITSVGESGCYYNQTKTCSGGYKFPAYPQYYGATRTAVCPSGYTSNGLLCVMTNPPAAKPREDFPDGKQDLGRTSGPAPAFVPMPDYDAGTTGAVVSPLPYRLRTKDHANDTAEVTGILPNGNVASVQVQALPSGGSRITILEQVQDAAQNSFVKERIVTVSQEAQVVADSQTMTPARLEIDPATQSATKVAAEPGTSTNYQPALNIQFPTDYARQGEAASAADSLGNRLLQTSAAPADPTLPNTADFDNAFFNGTFDALKGWQVPGHVSQCPAPGFDFNGQQYTLQSHCQLWADHSSVIAAAMMVVWSVVALFIVLRA